MPATRRWWTSLTRSRTSSDRSWKAPMTQDMPDAKAEFVQERLLEAAAEVLASVSNAAMPLHIVAARAGATTGAIQYYFGDKRGLLLAVMRKHGLRVVARLQLLETDTLPAPQVRARKILFRSEERRVGKEGGCGESS